jgi:hypothetical protein
LDRFLQVVLDFFVREFGRVDANDHQFVGVFLLQFPQLRKDVDAVDSTIGPEVQDNNLPRQIGLGQRTVCIHPLQTNGKFRSVSLSSEGRFCHSLSRFGLAISVQPSAIQFGAEYLRAIDRHRTK